MKREGPILFPISKTGSLKESKTNFLEEKIKCKASNYTKRKYFDFSCNAFHTTTSRDKQCSRKFCVWSSYVAIIINSTLITEDKYDITVHTALTEGISMSSPKTYTPGASNVWFIRATNPAPLADLASKTYCSKLWLWLNVLTSFSAMMTGACN